MNLTVETSNLLQVPKEEDGGLTYLDTPPPSPKLFSPANVTKGDKKRKEKEARNLKRL